MTLRAAIFLDRDGTVIADAHYLADPAGVRLLQGAARAVRRANDRGVPVVMVTNQSGIGRGMITLSQYEAVRERMGELLARHSAFVDATYHCPHSPDTQACECRKPGLGMYQQAAADLRVDLALSVYVGDRWRDVQPANIVGGLGILVPGAETPEPDLERARAAVSERLRIAADIGEAVDIALAAIASAAPTAQEQSLRGAAAQP